MRSGCVYAQPTSALRTVGTDGSGSRGDETGWRTPSAEEAGPDLSTLASADGSAPKVGERIYRTRPDGSIINQQQSLELQTKIWPSTEWQTPAAFLGMYRRQVGQTTREEELLPAQAANWPTPQATDEKRDRCSDEWIAKTMARENCSQELAHDARLWPSAAAWPTPIAGDAHLSSNPEAAASRLDEGKVTLSRLVETAWPSTCSRPAPAGGVTSEAVGSSLSIETLPDGSKCLRLGPTSRRRLNPLFVEWLCGLPHGWTAYEPVEIRSWLSKARRLLSSCSAAHL